jgi:hypothetical protein
MKIALYLMLAAVSMQLPAQTVASSGQTAPTQVGAAGAKSSTDDPALRESLLAVQAMAQKSDADVARLRIGKWKTDGQNKQQSEANAASIQKNLTSAIPDLLLRVQAEPGSLIASFRLYRNLNALFDSFSALAESAGAFGPDDQYSPLAADVAQLDQLRRQFAQRVDLLAEASDAELVRLRAAAARAAPKPAAKAGSKIVVDDSHPAPKKKPKPPAAKPSPAIPAAAAAPAPTGPAVDASQPAPSKKQKPSPYPQQQ